MEGIELSNWYKLHFQASKMPKSGLPKPGTLDLGVSQGVRNFIFKQQKCRKGAPGNKVGLTSGTLDQP
jgi:hypothetical protein